MIAINCILMDCIIFAKEYAMCKFYNTFYNDEVAKGK